MTSPLLLLLFVAAAQAAMFRAGPESEWKHPREIAARLAPGDVLEVAAGTYTGGVSFDASGTAERPIVIRGIARGGRRPVFRTGGGHKIGTVVRLVGSHQIFDGFEVTADGDAAVSRGIRTLGDGIVIRDVRVHHVAGHGILGSDSGGSVTLSSVEVDHCGRGASEHQVYFGADMVKFPNATLRVEHCHLHDAVSGNDLKTRVGRNEIYHNWIESGAYLLLDLLGPEKNAGTIRCHSDVVGNVLLKSPRNNTPVIRAGTDGSGASRGRHRFAFNTILVPRETPAGVAMLKLAGELESVEWHHNVVWHHGLPVRLLHDTAKPHAASGAGNWLPAKSSAVPANWAAWLAPGDPVFLGAAKFQFAPAPRSPLRDAARAPTASPANAPFPRPLAAPTHEPRRLNGTAAVPVRPRHHDGSPDTGAFEATF